MYLRTHKGLRHAVHMLQENYHSGNLFYQANADEVGNSPLDHPCPVEHYEPIMSAAISRRQGSAERSLKCLLVKMLSQISKTKI